MFHEPPDLIYAHHILQREHRREACRPLVRVSLSCQPPVPLPNVVPLPTLGAGTARTAQLDAVFAPYHGALPTLEIRGCGMAG